MKRVACREGLLIVRSLFKKEGVDMHTHTNRDVLIMDTDPIQEVAREIESEAEELVDFDASSTDPPTSLQDFVYYINQITETYLPFALFTPIFSMSQLYSNEYNQSIVEDQIGRAHV